MEEHNIQVAVRTAVSRTRLSDEFFLSFFSDDLAYCLDRPTIAPSGSHTNSRDLVVTDVAFID